MKKKRQIYDQYGEEGLRGQASGGFTTDHAGGTRTHHFTFMNAEDIFKQFFGNENPFASFGMGSGGQRMHFQQSNDNGMGGYTFTTVGGNQMNEDMDTNMGNMQPQQAPPIETRLYCTLEELYKGATKKMRIIRKRLNPDGYTTRDEAKILEINVKPGWKVGTKITFPKEGDEKSGIIPGDIIFVVTEKPHPRFKRLGNNLMYKHHIDLKQALTGFIIEIETLDNRILRMPVSKIPSSEYVHKIPHEGMPISKGKTSKGDLLIEFCVRFPGRLTEDEKKFVNEHFSKQLTSI